MSIKGIDTQIMITRSAELVKESSNQLKKNELMQDYMNIQAAEFERQKKQGVLKASEAGELRLHQDGENGQKNATFKRQKNKKQSNSTGEELQIPPNPGGKYKIDIKI